MRFIWLIACLLGPTVSATPVGAGIREDVEALFTLDATEFDFARVKLEADRIVDPSLDIEAELARIDEMVVILKRAIHDGADDRSKIEAVKHILYQPGWWNEDRVFSYDHTDPFGQNARNRLLSDYLDDRQGNCVTMPFLMIILGQRLGLDVAPALAPIHVLVKFTDEQGVTYNMEATSGGGIARDAYYHEVFPITDRAIEAGIYLRALTDEEATAVIGSVVVEHLMQQGRYREALDAADVLLSHYPDFAYMHVKRGTAAYYLLKTNFYDKYPTAQDVPVEQHGYLRRWQRINEQSFEKADSLGWKPMNLDRPLPSQPQ